MRPRRLFRLRELFIEELSNVIHDKVKDPRLGFVTVTDVEISSDLEHAKVFISVLEEGEVAKRTLEGLENAAGFIRYELKKRIKNLRNFPVLSFHLDESLKRGSQVIEALNKLQEDEES
jgi:ribosome-binding factor A